MEVLKTKSEYLGARNVSMFTLSILSPPLCSAPAVCGEGGAGSGHQHNRSFKRVKLVLWIISGGSRAGPKITTNKGREQINKTQQRHPCHKRSM